VIVTHRLYDRPAVAWAINADWLFSGVETRSVYFQWSGFWATGLGWGPRLGVVQLEGQWPHAGGTALDRLPLTRQLSKLSLAETISSPDPSNESAPAGGAARKAKGWQFTSRRGIAWSARRGIGGRVGAPCGSRQACGLMVARLGSTRWA